MAIWENAMSPIIEKKPATESYPEIFDTMTLIYECLKKWIAGARPLAERPHYSDAQIGVVVRGLNQYGSIINLLENRGYEDALILTRSMFELLLTAEELVRQEAANPEKASMEFILFSQLQDYLRERTLELYQIATGRATKETEARVKWRDAKARDWFSPFWRPVSKPGRKKGKKKKKSREIYETEGGRWAPVWCGKRVDTLSDESENPMRKHQYETLYRWGSSLAHATPHVVFSAALPRVLQPTDKEEFRSYMDLKEEKGLRVAASLSSSFLIEIVSLFADRFPDYDSDWVINDLPNIMTKTLMGVDPETIPKPKFTK
jgi:hypothetical protein